MAAYAGCAMAVEPALVVEGGCRDGQPNGAFTVRMPNGQPRIVGAFHDGVRTGTFIFWTAGGERLAVIPYEDGQPNGTIALWHAGRSSGAPARRLEAPVSRGEPHGTWRAWYANGHLRYEATYEHGALRKAAAWEANGRAAQTEHARGMIEAERRREHSDIARLAKMIDDHRPRCD